MKKIVVEIYHYQITSIIAMILILYGITFLAGYFWGKKSALEEFADQIKNESFSDKVYASLCSLYEQPGEAQASSNGSVEIADDTLQDQPNNSAEEKEIKQQGTFIAQLIGYGTEKQAQAYVKALERKGIAASVVTRTSVSSRGKKRTWYQVVTSPASYDETQRLVERLAIEDRLAGVSIIEETANKE